MNACTIVAKNYLSHARVLAASLREHHPDGRFTVLVIDDPEGRFDPAGEPFDVLGLGDLGLPDVEAMATRYDVLELSTAVKPWLLRTLLDRDDHVLYLDPDIAIYGSLEPLAAAARTRGLVLTPHSLTPMPRDGKKPSEADILIAGAYNLGFIGLGVRDAAHAMLDWWSERLVTDCVVDPARGFFVDQRWIDLVLGIVSEFEIVRDPGYNVAYWNLFARTLGKDGDRYTVDGVPLRFFHFSGYDPRTPHLLSKHQNRIRLENDPVLGELCADYGARLQREGFAEVIEWPYTYARTPGGVALDRTLRRAWATAVQAGDLEAPLFTAEGERAFLDWLAEPAPDAGTTGVNRFMWLHWLARDDLQRAFPVLHRDGAGLVEWFQLRGVEQLSVPPGLVPPGPGTPPATAEAAPAPARRVQLGVNVAGYLRSEHGVGEVARQVISALDAADVPLYPVGVVASASRQGHAFAAGTPDEAPYPINLLCVNADQTTSFAHQAGTRFFAARRTIGWWWWEVAGLPAEWSGAFDVVDEVWAGSRFIAGNLAAISPVPVVRIPTPVALPPDVYADRQSLGLPPGFLFLFTFDHNSVFERKNPLGVIEAFRAAFADPDADGPRLVIRSINADRFPREHRRLVDAAADRDDIVVMDRYLSAVEKNRMLASCDCYVSLHRAEGFGIGMAEAMLLGKPVIATAWSGSADFVLDDHSYPVGHRLVAIGPGNEPYPSDGCWAAPDVEQAARHMREVVEHPEEAAARGARAAEFIRTQHSPAAAGAAMRARLEAVADKVGRSGAEVIAPPPVTLDAVARRTYQGPPPSPRPRLHPRRIGRAAVLRLASPQRQHQEELDREIVSGVEYVADQLRSYTRAIGAELQSEIARQSARARADALAVDRRTRADLQALAHRIEEVVLAHESVRDRLDEIVAELHAAPYVDGAPFVLRSIAGAGRALGYRDTEGVATDGGAYLAFENVFRGSEDFIRERQRPYLEFVAGHEPVLDVGCGRGEFLDLLGERGVPARGVDADAALVRHCRDKGHDVVEADANAHLETLEDGSIGAIFCAQVVEHLPVDALERFLVLSRRKLRGDGVLIAETVNPHAPSALKAFWVDLTHQHPIFPEVLLEYCRSAGFREAFAFHPLGTGDYERDRTANGEYTVVARPQPQPHLP